MRINSHKPGHGRFQLCFPGAMWETLRGSNSGQGHREVVASPALGMFKAALHQVRSHALATV